MPFYVFTCEGGHITEARRGYDVSRIPCRACGLEATRASFGLPFIIGDTMPKGQSVRSGPAKDKYGRYRLDLVQEASEELREAGITTSRMYQGSLSRARGMGVPIRRG